MGYRWAIKFIHENSVATGHSATISHDHMGQQQCRAGSAQCAENTNILDRRDFTRQRLPLRCHRIRRRETQRIVSQSSSSSRIRVNDSWESMYLRTRRFSSGSYDIIVELRDSYSHEKLLRYIRSCHVSKLESIRCLYYISSERENRNFFRIYIKILYLYNIFFVHFFDTLGFKSYL